MLLRPWTGKHSRDTLESELGDVEAITMLLASHGTIDIHRVNANADAKTEAFKVNDGRLRSVRVRTNEES